MSGSEKQTEHVPSRQGVLCAKCEHLNVRTNNVCEYCGSHLHVVCHNCGHRNERVRTRCIDCGHRLHRSWLSRLSNSFGKNRKMSLIQTVLLVLGILIGIAIIVFFSEFRIPEQ
jgi:hypothetical protein